MPIREYYPCMSELQPMTDPMSSPYSGATAVSGISTDQAELEGQPELGNSSTDSGKLSAGSALVNPATSASNVRSVDRDLLLCLRTGEPKTIGDLTELLGVTATAIRQRIERLLEIGLIDREKVVAGRGRPTFRYLLTVAGYRRAGADVSVFAEAMWREIVDLPDEEIREGLLAAIAKRMGSQYAAAMQVEEPDVSTEQANEQFARRIRQLSEMLQSREIPAMVSTSEHSNLPVLDIEACPYPSMTDASEDRTMCRLEEKMLSEALGEDVQLSSCRLDGDACCQFTTKSDSST